jgi:ParB/RepB/Spo0J family partition protein
MTSGDFHRVPIESIKLKREERQRSELEDIPNLADSISKRGLINPLTITRDHDLVAGECRLAAVKSLGWTHVSIQYVDELEESALKAIELEENIKRHALPWEDECLAIYDYFQIRRVEDPTFTQEDLEEAIGLDQTGISRRIMVGSALRAGNPKIRQAPKFSTAVGILERAKAREAEEAEEAFKRMLNPDRVRAPDPVLNLDFNEWVKTYDGPRFNFVHCDFPYGIESDGFNQGAAALHGGYVDRARGRTGAGR